MVWHADTALPKGTDLVVVPGGFSYGDYLRCGAMAANSPIMREVKKRADAGTRVLAVCNGFQIACEAGLLQWPTGKPHWLVSLGQLANDVDKKFY